MDEPSAFCIDLTDVSNDDNGVFEAGIYVCVNTHKLTPVEINGKKHSVLPIIGPFENAYAAGHAVSSLLDIATPTPFVPVSAIDTLKSLGMDTSLLEEQAEAPDETELMDDLPIKINLCRPNAVRPTYATKGSAGADLHAAESCAIAPGDTVLVATGLQMEIPEGFEVQIRPRSGLAFKNGITVLNSPGTIDSDYRGEIGVLLHNTSGEHFVVRTGDRIAQMVVSSVYQAFFIDGETLQETERGEGGFGSTGVSS